MLGIIGKKVGMTTIYKENGEAVPVTVINAGPNYITQIKTVEKDGYNSVQLGFEEVKEKQRKEKINGKIKQVKKAINRPYDGHFKAKNVPVLRHLHEFKVEKVEDFEAGQKITCENIEEDKKVDVIGISKGKGFAGVMKRHGFSGGPATHGGMDHRGTGSRGGSSDWSRIFPGKKTGGHMGDAKVTQQNLEVVKVDKENNVVLVKGAIPGAKNGVVYIKPAKKA
ncbi:MAG: 50S ribosomal protein L3 [Candidatus Muiribacteriota bacterium]